MGILAQLLGQFFFWDKGGMEEMKGEREETGTGLCDFLVKDRPDFLLGYISSFFDLDQPRFSCLFSFQTCRFVSQLMFHFRTEECDGVYRNLNEENPEKVSRMTRPCSGRFSCARRKDEKTWLKAEQNFSKAERHGICFCCDM